MDLRKKINPPQRPEGDMYTGPDLNLGRGHSTTFARPNDLLLRQDPVASRNVPHPTNEAQYIPPRPLEISIQVEDLEDTSESESHGTNSHSGTPSERSYSKQPSNIGSSSSTLFESTEAQSRRQAGLLFGNMDRESQLEWYHKQAERKADAVVKRNIALCNFYDQKTELELIEEEMATSSEDETVETAERKRLEVERFPATWGKLCSGIQLDILRHLQSTTHNLGPLKLTRTEKENAMKLLFEYNEFQQRADNASTEWTKLRMLYEAQEKRPLTQEEEQEIMHRTILAVEGEDKFDKPVKDHEIAMGRKFLQQCGLDPEIIKVHTSVPSTNTSGFARRPHPEMSEHLRHAYEQGPAAFPSLPLHASEEEIRHAPRRKPGLTYTNPETTTLVEMEQEEALDRRRKRRKIDQQASSRLSEIERMLEPSEGTWPRSRPMTAFRPRMGSDYISAGGEFKVPSRQSLGNTQRVPPQRQKSPQGRAARAD